MGRCAVRPPPRHAFSPVTWRDGVHLTGSPLWCDARRRRDVCFVSSAERVGRGGHGQLIGTPITLALLAPGPAALAPMRGNTAGDLAVPLRQRFTLGTSRLELIPSGRGFGAAALHVDLAGRRVLYAGPVRTTLGGAGEAGEVRTADAVVVAAPFGEPRHVFPAIDTVVDQVVTWCRAQLAREARPTLVVDTALDGLEVAQRLGGADLPLAGGKAVRDAIARLPAALGLPALRAPSREPAALLLVDGERRPPTPGPVALLSGRALDPPAAHAPYAQTFAWAHAADRARLLAWIEATRAKDVFVTGACAETIVAKLGPRARVIGPPRQMTLFPREAS